MKYRRDSDCESNNNLELKRISVESEFKQLELSDLQVVATLGIGGFGRVELVSKAHLSDDCENFAKWFGKISLLHHNSLIFISYVGLLR